jgi:uncharacterized membrane protein
VSTALASRWRRFDGAGRLAGIDLARGLAVIGMFAAHLLWIAPFSWTDPSTWTDVANGRSSILFATLAGVSIGLVTGGRTPVTGTALASARLRLGARAALLWVIGILLIATGVPVFVILPAYAVLFLLALPFLKLGPRVLLPLAAVIAVVMPFVQVLLDALPLWRTAPGEALGLVIGWHYPFTTWIAFVLCGLGLGRLDLRAARVQGLLVAIGGAIAAVAYSLHAFSGSDTTGEAASLWGAVWTARAHSTGLLEVVGSGGFAVAVIGLCLLVCRTVLRWVVIPLRAVGAMPLSAYTAQIVVWAAVAIAMLAEPGDLGRFRALDPFWPFTLWTIVACTAWTLLIGRGPLEWAVDRLTRLIARASSQKTGP